MTLCASTQYLFTGEWRRLHPPPTVVASGAERLSLWLRPADLDGETGMTIPNEAPDPAPSTGWEKPPYQVKQG